MKNASNTTKILAVVMALSIFTAVVFQISRFLKKKDPATHTAAVVPHVEAPPSAISPVSAESYEKKAFSENLLNQPWGRDPFASPEQKIQPKSEIEVGKATTTLPSRPITINEPVIHLTAILIQGSEKAAIVNRSIVHEGDKIEGASVEEISEGQVVLVKDNRKIILKPEQS